MSGIIFEDNFRINHINLEGDFFDRVSRLHCVSETLKMDMILDINSWVYPQEVGDKFQLIMTTTLRRCGTGPPDDISVLSEPDNRANDFEYVMYGKIIRIDEAPATQETEARLTAYISFGGLMMRLQGNAKNLHAFDNDKNVFLMMKHLDH